MEYDTLTLKILKRLSANIPPSANQLKADKNMLLEKLNEMKNDNLIDFELYGKNHPVFANDPTNFRLTTKGREIANNTNIPI